MKLLISLVLSLGATAAIALPNVSSVKGKLNGANVNLVINSTENTTQILGNLDNNATKLLVKKVGSKTTLLGLVNGKKMDLAIENKDNVATFSGEFNNQPTNMSIENRPFGTIFSGDFDGQSLSTKIDKSKEDFMWITGFYRRDLVDLRIYKNKNLNRFDGYINGNWAKFTIETVGNKSYFSGHLHGEVIELEADTSALPLSDLVELILFNVFVPDFSIVEM